MNIEAKLKHLEFLQNIITRMAHNSFLLKGWLITLVGVILGLNKSNIDARIVTISIFLSIVFWILDGYFLSQERYFRSRYDEVSKKDPKDIDFSMKLENKPSVDVGWFVTFWSVTLRLYYGGILGAIFIFGFFM